MVKSPVIKKVKVTMKNSKKINGSKYHDELENKVPQKAK